MLPDLVSPDEPDYDAMSDEDLLARCAASRAALREMECVQGLAMLQPDRGFSDEEHLAHFMGIFHPGHPVTEMAPFQLRQLVRDV